ncbi:type III polyketide synthase [soil metagenome]
MKQSINLQGFTAITCIGTATPPYKQLQIHTAELIANSLNLTSSEKRVLKSIYKATGIEQRYSVLSDYCKSVGEFTFFPNEKNALFPSTAARMEVYKENALGLALLAIENCLANLVYFNKNDITHLITVSCTGMYAPGIDIEIVHKLNLNPSTKRTAISFMGCYGAFNAIKIADAICKADKDATVLIVCIELCTIHLQKSMNLDDIISNSLFSDGAAAILVQAKTQQEKFFTLQHFHNDLLPQTNEQMAWRIGDYGFDIVLSSYIPEIIQSGIGMFAENLLKQANFTLADVDFYAIHPGGRKILEACETALDIDKDDNKYSYEILRNYGNMSSATVLFVLKAIWEDINYQHDQKNIFSCAFGPGLTLESMMLKTYCI